MGKYFVTGASGFIGSAVVEELISNGHQVIGLARSQESAEKIKSCGGEAVIGDLTSLDVLKSAAKESDGVIHLGFINNFADMDTSVKIDREAVEALADALEGSDKPLVYTHGLLAFCLVPTDTFIDENFREVQGQGWARQRTENEAFVLGLKNRGIKSMSVRLSPTVHDIGDKGFVPHWIKCANEKGFVAYPSEGTNVWPAINRRDAAVLYRLAVEKGEADSALHGMSELISTKKIAEAIGKKHGLEVKSIPPEHYAEYFGFLAFFISANGKTSADITKKSLGWVPKYPLLEEDILTNY